MAAGGPTRDHIAALLHQLYIGVPGTQLRDEDRKKVEEVHALCGVLERILPGKRPATIVDVAAGRSFLGFAAAVLLRPGRTQPLRYVGVERDAAAVGRARGALARAGAADFEIVQGDAADAPLPERPDLLVALHACGDATDHALRRAVALGARHVILVPCCHRRSAPPGLDRLGLPDQAGIRVPLEELLVDARRVLELEAAGYEVTVFDLVPPAVTSRNRTLRARRLAEPRRATDAARRLARLRALIG